MISFITSRKGWISFYLECVDMSYLLDLFI